MAVLQVSAVLVVVWYFRSPGLQAFARQVGQWKTAGGLPFAFLAGAIAGGAMPVLALIATRKFTGDWGRAVWSGLVYGIIGIFVDLLYLLLGQWIGRGNEYPVVATKVAIDMFVFSPFLSIPTAAFLFAWWREKLRGSYFKDALSRRFYVDEVLKALPLTWAFWIPMLCCIYVLPVPIQFPFAMLIEAAWSVLFVTLKLDS